MTRRRTECEVLPVREELESLVHAYYHLHKEHKQAAPESTTRRHVEVFTYAAEPGSRSAEGLKLLGSWAATVDSAESTHATNQS